MEQHHSMPSETMQQAPIELDFHRDENKFFVPASFAETMIGQMKTLCEQSGFQKEVHEHPITRSFYFFAGDVDSLPPGFSVRYREYVDHKMNEGGSIGENDTGFMELKWWDNEQGKPPIKRKVRIQEPFTSEQSFADIIASVSHLQEEGKIDIDTVTSLKRTIVTMGLDIDQQMLRPLFLNEYRRERFVKSMPGGKKNIISIDTDLDFYDMTSETVSGVAPHHIGSMPGAVMEYKESGKDEALQWQVTKILARNNAVRFYGKKGEALNLLQRSRSKDAPKIKNELAGYEIEAKMDLLTGVPEATRFVSSLYDYFDHEDPAFTITPGFRALNSQSNMATYLEDPTDVSKEGKLLVGMGIEAKFTSKHIIERNDETGLLVREEHKGERFSYERTKARQALEGMNIVGKTRRIRRAFYISSAATDRVYKVAVDFNWTLPVQDNQFFSQVEVEYAGIPIGQYAEGVQIQDATAEQIKHEVVQAMQAITENADKQGIEHRMGGRKVDILSQN